VIAVVQGNYTGFVQRVRQNTAGADESRGGRQVHCMHDQHIAGKGFVVKFRTLDGLCN
jgi:hypothetical protein